MSRRYIIDVSQFSKVQMLEFCEFMDFYYNTLLAPYRAEQFYLKMLDSQERHRLYDSGKNGVFSLIFDDNDALISYTFLQSLTVVEVSRDESTYDAVVDDTSLSENRKLMITLGHNPFRIINYHGGQCC